MPTKVVPIRFVDHLGNPSGPDHDVRMAIPVFDVTLCAPTDFTIAAQGNGIALVDTGADSNHATPESIHSLSLHRLYDGETHSVHGTAASTAYSGGLYFPSAQLLISTEITSDVFRNRCYSVIVGRRTLEMGCLVMDYPNRIFEWRVPIP